LRFASLAPVNDTISGMELLYDKFDIGLDGRPSVAWERRNLKLHRLDEPLKHAFFPDVFVYKTWVNRRMTAALGQVMREINMRWTAEARSAYGLDQFVKCYCFGDGESPNLHWYAAAWTLSPQVSGEALTEAVKVFTRHGFTYCGAADKKRIRTFEYW
jgi:hypothetical protein